MLTSGGDDRRDRWLLVLSGARNALLFISFLLIVSFFRSDPGNVFLRRTIVAEIAALLIFGLLWLIWQRSGMAAYQQRVKARLQQGSAPSYNYRAVTTGWLAFVSTMLGSIFISVFVSAIFGL